MRQLLILLLVPLLGCGAVSFRANTLLPSNTVVVTGLVSIVQFTTVVDNTGIVVDVTVVALQQFGVASNFTFCGNQVNVFPLNTVAQVAFVPGQQCGTVVQVSLR